MMRIISGRYKGRIIKMPKGIRPTQDKVRKALFDILANIEGLSFLELFAGSGAVGIEALSQGAKKAVFVENNPSCIEALKANFTYLLPGTYYLLPLDVVEAIKRLRQKNEKFDIIFFDPPYYKDMVPRLRPSTHFVRSGQAPDLSKGCLGLARTDNSISLAKKTLQSLEAYDILAANGFIIVQHFKKDNLPDAQGGLVLFRQARYGDTLLSFYRREDVPESDISGNL